MKRLYAAVPLTYEDNLLKILGRLGTVQLVSDYTIKGFKKVDNVEKSEKYVKLQQRIGSVLSSLPSEEKVRQSINSCLRRKLVEGYLVNNEKKEVLFVKKTELQNFVLNTISKLKTTDIYQIAELLNLNPSELEVILTNQIRNTKN